MATVLINSWPLYGPVNCLLDIAGRLQRDGHRVYFIGIADCEAMVTAQGFEFFPVFERIFHKGILRQANEIRDNCTTLTDIYRAVMEQKQRICDYFEFLLEDGNNEFQAVIESVKPDIFLIEGSTETSSVWALLGYKNNIKSAYVNTILPFRKSAFLPPLDSHIIPDKSPLNRLQIHLSWLRFYTIRTLRHYFFDARWNKHIIALAKAWSYPRSLVDTTPFACTLIDLPELCTTPSFFDFPNTVQSNREVGFYLESHDDRACDYPDPPWEQIEKGKKLIYCSLGSHYISAEQKQRFYQAVLQAVAENSDWHLILSTGNTLGPEDFSFIPSNAILMEMVSQKNVLKKADIMITHGGINSIKECIFYGVPMLVYPIKFDQPGDAARVQYHKIGLRKNFNKATAESIGESLRYLLGSEEIKKNVLVMSEKYQLQLDGGIQWIETLLDVS